jgi:indole-3-glycerol phosphate synthase
MEALILTCLQAKLLVGRVNAQDIPKQQKNELILEFKQISPKECKVDADVEQKERTNTLNK